MSLVSLIRSTAVVAGLVAASSASALVAVGPGTPTYDISRDLKSTGPFDNPPWALGAYDPVNGLQGADEGEKGDGVYADVISWRVGGNFVINNRGGPADFGSLLGFGTDLDVPGNSVFFLAQPNSAVGAALLNFFDASLSLSATMTLLYDPGDVDWYGGFVRLYQRPDSSAAFELLAGGQLTGSAPTISFTGRRDGPGVYAALFGGIARSGPGTARFAGSEDGDGPPGFPFGIASLQMTASVVPEPETWAMMIVGFGLVGAVMRRRRAAPAPAIA